MANDTQRTKFANECMQEWYEMDPPYDPRIIEFIIFCVRKWEEEVDEAYAAMEAEGYAAMEAEGREAMQREAWHRKEQEG